MSDSPIHVAPRAFISYSWTNPAHEAWVLDLAMRLVSDGIDIILDKWELRPGHDSYAFMESMVTDPTVTKVIMICDQAYVTKANARAGGAGTEGQIISPELYGKVAQNKYAALVTEVDGRGHRHVPMFYKGRIYFDFVSGDAFEAQYEALLRWLADKPLFVKPPVGRLPEKILGEPRDSKPKVTPKIEQSKPKIDKPVRDEAFGREITELALKEIKRARNQGELNRALRLALGGWAIARTHTGSVAPALATMLANIVLNCSEAFVFSNHDNSINSAEFSHDGSMILTSSFTDVNLYQNEGNHYKKIAITIELDGSIEDAKFSKDGRYIAVVAEKNTKMLDLFDLNKIHVINGFHSPLDFSFDRKFCIGTYLNEVRKIELNSNNYPKCFPLAYYPITSLAYSSDSKLILIGTSGGVILLIDGILGDIKSTINFLDDSITQATFSSEDQFIAYGDDAGNVAIRKTVTIEPFGIIKHRGSISSLSFSSDGLRLLTASHDKTAQLWDVSTKNSIGDAMHHDGEVVDAKFSADGKRIVTASRNCARLWDGLTGAPIGTPIEHPDWVEIVRFSPDGQSILTACDDNKVRLWDISSTYLEGNALIEHVCRNHLTNDQEFTDAELRASMIPDLPRNPVAACLAWLEANR